MWNHICSQFSSNRAQTTYLRSLARTLQARTRRVAAMSRALDPWQNGLLDDTCSWHGMGEWPARRLTGWVLRVDAIVFNNDGFDKAGRRRILKAVTKIYNWLDVNSNLATLAECEVGTAQVHTTTNSSTITRVGYCIVYDFWCIPCFANTLNDSTIHHNRPDNGFGV